MVIAPCMERANIHETGEYAVSAHVMSIHAWRRLMLLREHVLLLVLCLVCVLCVCWCYRGVVVCASV